ncbi:MAG: AraC family transcriptional regulator [Clostridia bacterium]|nr:AraC family transcriptional regulator [Clostridia bacterium]
MKIIDLVNHEDFKLISKISQTEREIAGVECCDLLSWVMANGQEGEAWITVQIHSNIVAVATLLDFSCIIVPENIEVDAEVIEKATDEDIPVFSTQLDAYGIFKVFYEAGI